MRWIDEVHGEQLEKGQAEGVVLVLGAALRLPLSSRKADGESP